MKKADRILTINWDLDGVVYNFGDQIREIANRPMVRSLMEAYGAPLPEGVVPTNTEWNMEKAFNISKKAFWHLFYIGVEQGAFADGKAFPDSIETVDYCVRRGHRVRIVTSKQFSDPAMSLKAQVDVLTWLYMNTPWYHKVEIAFASDKQGYLADVVIDDKPDLSWVQDPAVNLLVARPWNATHGDFDLSDIPWRPIDIRRVEVAEIRGVIEKLEEA